MWLPPNASRALSTHLQGGHLEVAPQNWGNWRAGRKCNLGLELPDYESCIMFRHVETVETESNTLEESRMLKNV
jgi:hypothetical protein